MNDLVQRIREGRYNVFEDIVLECSDRCPHPESAEIFRLLAKNFPEAGAAKPQDVIFDSHQGYEDGMDKGFEDGVNKSADEVREAMRGMASGPVLTALSKLLEQIETLAP